MDLHAYTQYSSKFTIRSILVFALTCCAIGSRSRTLSPIFQYTHCTMKLLLQVIKECTDESNPTSNDSDTVAAARYTGTRKYIKVYYIRVQSLALEVPDIIHWLGSARAIYPRGSCHASKSEPAMPQHIYSRYTLSVEMFHVHNFECARAREALVCLPVCLTEFCTLPCLEII